jgi:hypothetical protein
VALAVGDEVGARGGHRVEDAGPGERDFGALDAGCERMLP